MIRGRWSPVGLPLALALLAGACSTADDSREPTSGLEPVTRVGPAQVCFSAEPSSRVDSADFHDITADTGIEELLVGIRGHATAAGDVNDDGWADLFVGGFADRPTETYAVRGATGPAPDRLLLGGPGGFELDESFPGQLARTSGAAFADLDTDGDLDLVLARNPRDTDRGRAGTVVLRNDNGRFSLATTLDERRGGRSVGILDHDGDGRLDIFLVEDRFSGGSSALFANQGDFSFADHTEASGLPPDLYGLGVSVTDLDGDTWPDLFVAGANRLFVNEGGSFREAPHRVFGWDVHGDEDDVAGVASADVNGDGRPDLVLGQHYNSTLDQGRTIPVRLYLNDGLDDDGMPVFRDVTVESGLVELPTKAPHVEIVDLDHDGRPDILTTASAGGGTEPAVLWNLGGTGGAVRFDEPEALGDPQYWVGGVTLDVDRDGALDVFLVEWEPALGSVMLTSTRHRGHWLAVQIGDVGADGIGAVVEAYEAGHLGDPDRRLAAREIVASTGYGSGSLPVARFGLGEIDQVDLRVVLPVGGGLIEAEGVPADSQVVLMGSCGMPESREE